MFGLTDDYYAAHDPLPAPIHTRCKQSCTPYNLLFPSANGKPEPWHDAHALQDDTTSISLYEGIYILLLTMAGVGLEYVASTLSWPENLAPLSALAILLYLLTTHGSAPSSCRIRLTPAVDDEESLIFPNAAMLEATVDAGKVSEQLQAILMEKRSGRLAEVYAFGKPKPAGCGGGPVWVIVEDMDA